jgi:hypothetical protein
LFFLCSVHPQYFLLLIVLCFVKLLHLFVR